MPLRRNYYRAPSLDSEDDDYEPLQSIQNRQRHPARRIQPPSRANPPTAASRPSAISSSRSISHGIPSAPAQAAPGPSRPAEGGPPPQISGRPNVPEDEPVSSRDRYAVARRRLRRRVEDDEDVVYTGSSGAEDGQALAGPSRPRNRAPNHHIQRLNAALDARPRRDPDADRRQSLSNDSDLEDEIDLPPARPRIGLGGAVFRRGGARRQFVLGRPPTSPPQQHGQDAMAAPGQQFFLGGNNVGHFMMNALGAGMGFHIGLGGVGIAFGGAGPARAEADIETILRSVEVPKYPAPTAGFVANFDMEEAQSKQAIEIDDNGVVKKKRKQPILVCAKCKDPLLISEAYRTPADRIWALRCGHIIDQKCLDEIQAPRSIMEMASVDKHPDVLDEQPAKRRKGVRKAKEQEKPADEYTWKCPVEGCGKRHMSKDIGGSWVMGEGEGALQVYA
ncbi:hypothetical protein L198_06045 [Cryptococcus wingfieldii CBS 7118]|uniref:Uncharacterized protein n=1 Tax=Cryptococcus wingfieldii CBS 7118 TaxID=1295528 RepID=A0A1E3IQ56_9TREE|nr:hypothetical protein L198_06045 [Cryptococcus wingfieldii CBS 7118]ODN90729.1 hypothetical protein L198_06045 [Cryptococcus wingfieldii CBS 7118]